MKKNEKSQKEKGAMVMAEEKATGSIPASVYIRFFQMGGVGYFLFSLFVFLIAQSIRIFTDFWLGLWSEDGLSWTVGEYIGIYVLVSFVSGIFFMVRFIVFIKFSIRVCKNIFQNLLKVILKAPQWWFDITPTGRITARFTSDIDKIDFALGVIM